MLSLPWLEACAWLNDLWPAGFEGDVTLLLETDRGGVACPSFFTVGGMSPSCRKREEKRKTLLNRVDGTGPVSCATEQRSANNKIGAEQARVRQQSKAKTGAKPVIHSGRVVPIMPRQWCDDENALAEACQWLRVSHAVGMVNSIRRTTAGSNRQDTTDGIAVPGSAVRGSAGPAGPG